MAVQTHVGYVDAQLAEYAGDGRYGAAGVLIADDQRVEHTVEVYVDAVQLVHHDAPAANGRCLHGQCPAVGALGLDDGGVGVGIPQLDLVDGVGQPGLFRLGKGVRQAGIVRLHAQQTAHQRTVRAVAGARLGKGAVEVDGSLDRRRTQQCAGHGADLGGAGGVGAGGTDHHRTQYFKDIQHRKTPFRVCRGYCTT